MDFKQQVDEIVHSGYSDSNFKQLLEKVQRIKNQNDACASLSDNNDILIGKLKDIISEFEKVN